jgi:AmmeMemoRadiSam system protein A
MNGTRAAGLHLTMDERRFLLLRARIAVEAALRGAAPMPADETGALAEHCGVFVTWRRREDQALRGCIGLIEGAESLLRGVEKMAVAAALEDPRFSPVTTGEFPELQAEISALSPMASIHPEEVRVGCHGLMIRSGVRRGLLLPQVPEEQGWDREAFLEGVCRKAGLAPGSWRLPGVELFGFTATVFGEDSSS